MRSAAFWIGVVLGLLGIALPVVGVPRWVAWGMLAACALILLALAVGAGFSRYFTLQRKQKVDDPALPVRDDRRDLADNLDRFAGRLADWLDARAVQAPSIIDENTAAILGQSNLAQMIGIARGDPERWAAHQEASAHYDRTTRAEYLIGWRGEALALFDHAVHLGVVTPKVRERIEKPDMVQLRALPELLRRLVDRLRVQAAERLLAQRTVGHKLSPMRPTAPKAG